MADCGPASPDVGIDIRARGFKGRGRPNGELVLVHFASVIWPRRSRMADPIDAAASMAALRELLPVGADVNGQDGEGQSALWRASRRGLLVVVVHLAERLGALVTVADNFGRSPLYAAAGFAGGGGRLAVVQWLAGNGGSVAQPDIHGATPLFVASQ